MQAKWLLWVGNFVAILANSSGDSWKWPEPTSYCCRGFSYVAELFPPRSRQNPSEKTICYFYETGYSGKTWEIKAMLLWKAELANDTGPFKSPHQAILSMDGHLVTLNDHGSVGFRHVVVIYDKNGHLVKSFDFEEIIPKEDSHSFGWSTGSRWWNEEAKYFFMRNPARLYIVVKWGKVMEFSLVDAKFKLGVQGDFPDLAKVLEERFPNEETLIRATSLRFSSITDVLEARSKKE